MADALGKVYQEHADLYEEMILYEDYEGHLLPAIEAIQPVTKDSVIVEFGAGTGRLTRLLAPTAKGVHAFDLHYAMMSQGVEVLNTLKLKRWSASLGDNRRMPVKANSADMTIEGWSFLHIVVLFSEAWRDTAGAAIDEMERITRPGGHAILIETLGTGRSDPKAPIELFEEFYEYLETERGFEKTWIRTDFRFDSMAQAQEKLGFFFGKTSQKMEYMEFAEEGGYVVVPECTGIWWKKV